MPRAVSLAVQASQSNSGCPSVPALATKWLSKESSEVNQAVHLGQACRVAVDGSGPAAARTGSCPLPRLLPEAILIFVLNTISRIRGKGHHP
jgi:hypothetical protein